MVVKSCFYQLRLLAKVKPFLSVKNLETALHAFVTSRLDYCNSLYIGISQSCVNRLQLVQNAAARLLKDKRKCDHITPVLISLHWLPVQYRINFKVLLFVLQVLAESGTTVFIWINSFAHTCKVSKIGAIWFTSCS